MEGTPRSWSDIPLELAGHVFRRLIAPGDRVRFAAVCPQWRSAAQQAPLPLPLLALKDGTFYSMPRGERLRIPNCDDGFITASGNWLVYDRLHCLLLVDPFSGATMTLPATPSSYFPLRGHGDDEIASMDARYRTDLVLFKLIVCSPHLIAALFTACRGFQIAVCHPGASSWSVAQESHIGIFDITFYQEKLYAIDYFNNLLALDISVDDNTGDPQVAQIERVIKGGCWKLHTNFFTMFYLIESRGSLLMVRRKIFDGHIHDEGQIHTFAKQCKPDLAVFEADFTQSQWSKLTTLGDDQALFLGPCSRAVYVPRCELQDKRVWFLDDYKKYSILSGTDDRAIRKFSCPLPMISWRKHNGHAEKQKETIQFIIGFSAHVCPSVSWPKSRPATHDSDWHTPSPHTGRRHGRTGAGGGSTRRRIAGIRGFSTTPLPLVSESPQLMEGASSSWSDTPLDLAGLVLCRLHAHVDRVRFAAVCKQWCSAKQQTPLLPPLPLFALKDGTFYSLPRSEPLPGCDGDIVTASGNWLVYNCLHCLLLVDPFSGATMTLPALPNLDVVVVKLIVCSAHLIAALFQRGHGFWIAVCRPGASSWSVARKRYAWIFDIAFYQEKLYAVNYLNDLLALDISVDDSTGDPRVARIETVVDVRCVKIDGFQRVLYLVESRGSLLMVRRKILRRHIHDEGQIHTFAEQCDPDLAVFEADFGQSKWAKVTTLGDDQTLFLGQCSRAVFMPLWDSLDRRVWFLDDHKKGKPQDSCCESSGTGDMAISRKFSCPFPMISWRGHDGCNSAAMWVFPSN